MTLPRIAITDVLRTLEELYPDAHCALDHRNPFELLIATILSAQCTDKKVNEVTPALFARYPTPAAMAIADLADVEGLISECGLYKTKARNIIATSQVLMDIHNGTVPDSMEALIAMPGVGRKTANVVLSNAFLVPAIPVDTHVQRVSNRLGLASSDDVLETEQQLMQRVPKELWIQAHHWLIYHGRQVCAARSPKCESCALAPYCRHFKNQIKTSRRRASKTRD